LAASPNDHDPDAMSGLIAYVTSLITKCSDFINMFENPEPEARCTGSRTGKVGQPCHTFDLDKAVRLHQLGNSWGNVAKAFGVGCTTLWEHLKAAGIELGHPKQTEILDKELDNMVSLLSESHPFAGQQVMQGHLLAAGVNVTVQRVQALLWRVDAIAVVLW
jgi:hypothetical protein